MSKPNILSSTNGTRLTTEQLTNAYDLLQECNLRIQNINNGSYSRNPPIEFNSVTCPELSALVNKITNAAKDLNKTVFDTKPYNLYKFEICGEEMFGRMKHICGVINSPSKEQAESFLKELWDEDIEIKRVELSELSAPDNEETEVITWFSYLDE